MSETKQNYDGKPSYNALRSNVFFCVWTFINYCILIVSLCDCHTHSLKATYPVAPLWLPVTLLIVASNFIF